MARPGVTYSEVSAAATELKAQGKQPTIEQIRLLLGTGSSTTIANHLREWKQNQDQTSLIANKANLPEELVSTLKGLWLRVNQISEEKIQNLTQSYEESLKHLEQEVHKYKSNNQRWQVLFNQWNAEKQELLAQKSELEQSLRNADKENSDLNASHKALEQQQEEKQQRIQELHLMLRQVQENLEHYRESAREQRLLDQQQYEKEKSELQFQLKITNEQLINLREEQRSSLQKLNHMTNEIQQLNKTIQDQSEKITDAKLEISSFEKQIANYAAEAELLRQQQNDATQKLDKQSSQLIELHANNKVYAQQIQDKDANISELKETNKILAHEKWILSKEKAQLEGQLRQLDKIKNKELITS